MVKINKQ